MITHSKLTRLGILHLFTLLALAWLIVPGCGDTQTGPAGNDQSTPPAAATPAAATPAAAMPADTTTTTAAVVKPTRPIAKKRATNLPTRLEAGAAVIERLGPIFVDGAGPYVTARAGDWRLANERVSIIIASVDDPSTTSQPVGGYRMMWRPTDRVPGAVIDVATTANSLDFLGNFTQGIDINPDKPVINYDTAEPVRREGEVGLRLEASPSETSLLRLETTYWLAEGRDAVQIESRWLNAPAGSDLPIIFDAANWGVGVPLVGGSGYLPLESGAKVDAPYYVVQGGDLCVGVAPTTGTMESYFGSKPPRSRSLTFGEKLGAIQTIRREQKIITFKPRPKRVIPPVMERRLYIAAGDAATVTEIIQSAKALPTGTIEGRLTNPVNGKPIAGGTVDIARREVTAEMLVYTSVKTDAQGRFRVRVPEGVYAVRSLADYDKNLKDESTLTVKAGETQSADRQGSPMIPLSVKLVDSKTSQPIAGRIWFDAIAPTPPQNFGFPKSAAGYINYAYIPPQGRDFEIEAGHYTIHASHGIRYSTASDDVLTTVGKNAHPSTAKLVIPLKPINPTPGWDGVEMGARTKATAGCTVEPEDIVLMAVAEGIDWLISGDFETLTDFGPIIKKLGYEKQLGSSRGFRTILPAHPEWGQFFIFPVAADAPNPAAVRAEWAGLTTAAEFIARLRALYPGALIQSDLPYTEHGEGYFAYKNLTVYEIAYEINPQIDPSIDAINLFPARQPWEPKSQGAFFYNNMMRGRFYLCSTAPTGRTVLGSEPGYPRLLVATGRKKGEPLPDEKRLFEAIRAHHTQVTTAPFTDLTVAGNLPGTMIGPDPAQEMRLRITTPPWAPVSSFTYDKEGIGLIMRMLSSSGESAQVVPPDDYPEPYSIETLKEMDLIETKDTLLSVYTAGSVGLHPNVPSEHPNVLVPAVSFLSPFVIDANGNGKYDQLPYNEKGR